MTLQKLAYILVLAVSVASCSVQPPDSTGVYQALFSSLDRTERTFFIREQPATLSKEELSDDFKALYSSFRFPKDEKAHSAAEFGSLNVQFVSEEEYPRLFAGGCKSGWSQFHKRYPDAKSLIQISKIGFRSNNTEALVYITGGSGCLAGSGYLMLLKKNSGSWSLVQEFNLWRA